jgi:hypothetical protein
MGGTTTLSRRVAAGAQTGLRGFADAASPGGSGGEASSSGGAGGGAGGQGSVPDGASGAGGAGGQNMDADGGVPLDVGSGSCQDFTPCGGSFVGSWNYTSCFDPPLAGLSLLCSDVEETVSIDGTLEIRSDGTATGTAVVHTHAVVGASCVEALGGCGAQLGALTQCSPGPNGTCVCDTSNDNGANDSTYSTNGTILTIVEGGEVDYAYYCRQGDELLMRGLTSFGEVYVVRLTPR